MKQHTKHNIICLEAEWEYSEKRRIQGAIESGVSPRESLGLTSDDAKRSEMYYYDDNGQ